MLTAEIGSGTAPGNPYSKLISKSIPNNTVAAVEVVLVGIEAR
jgi:hypothetical protein